LRNTVSFIDMAALRAGTRGIARVNQFDQHPRQFGFVFDKGAQLKECPRGMLPPLATPNRYPVPDTAQILERDTATGVFSLCDNPLRDAVIFVRGEALFLLGALSEKTLARLRSLGLKFSTEFGMAFPEPVYSSPGIGLTLGVSGDVDDAEVNAQELANVSRWWFLNLTGLEKIEHSIPQYKVSFADKVRQEFCLPFSNGKRDAETAVKRPDRNDAVCQFPREDTFIVADAAMPSKKARSCFVHLIGIGHFSQHAHHYLGRQFKAAAQVVIEKMVEIVLPKGFGFPRLLTDMVCGIIYRLKSTEKRAVLGLIGKEFNLCNQLHACIITQSSRIEKKGGSGFLCQLKQAVSATHEL
jgi:hypothetical protein